MNRLFIYLFCGQWPDLTRIYMISLSKQFRIELDGQEGVWDWISFFTSLQVACVIIAAHGVVVTRGKILSYS